MFMRQAEHLPTMISQAADSTEQVEASRRELPTLQEVRDRIAAYDSGAEHSDVTREAALILLAAAEIGQNVDRLARFTGLRREIVARAARRLVDNGVWRGGNTVARWRENADDAESFWLDAAVAEGRLCRLVLDEGIMEWAPQGYWRKDYEYAGTRGEMPAQAVCYHPHVEPQPGNTPLWIPDEDEAEEEVEQREAVVVSEREPLIEEAAEAPPVWLGVEETPEPREEVLSAAVVGGASSLYLEAVWLG